METQTRVNTFAKAKTNELTWTTGLILIACLVPRFSHNQLVTGSIVNATLFLATMILCNRNAILIGTIPSIVALSAGTLPLILAPIVPFIFISNALLIVTYNYFEKLGCLNAVVLASIFKYLFLSTISYFVIHFVVKNQAAYKVTASMMSWIQLLTAIIGGVIAISIYKFIQKSE